jgi:hypothetical protein
MAKNIEVGQVKVLKIDLEVGGNGRRGLARAGSKVVVTKIPPQDGTVDSVTVEWSGMTAAVMKCDLE